MDGANAFANFFPQGTLNLNGQDFSSIAAAPPANAPMGGDSNTNNSISNQTTNDALNNIYGLGGMMGAGAIGGMGGLPPNLGANFAAGGLMNAAGMINALQQQQQQQQQQQPQPPQQPQQQQQQQPQGMMNPFANGILNPFAAATSFQGGGNGGFQGGLQLGIPGMTTQSLPQNMAGMFNPNLGVMGMMGGMQGSIPGISNLMAGMGGPAPAPQPASAPTPNLEDLKKELALQQMQQSAPAGLAQLFQNQTNTPAPIGQGFNPMMLLGGSTNNSNQGYPNASNNAAVAAAPTPLGALGVAGFNLGNTSGINTSNLNMAGLNTSALNAAGLNPSTLFSNAVFANPPASVDSNSNSDVASGGVPTNTAPPAPPAPAMLTDTTPTLAPATPSVVVPPAPAPIVPTVNNDTAQATPLPNTLFTSQANSLAALGALDASAFVGSGGVIKGPDKGKKSPKKKVKGKPKRPLSAYNLFFKDERERILKSLPGADQKKKKSKKDKGGGNGNEIDERDFDLTDKNGKKIPHGKIGFENLAKMIGRRWQELDPKEVDRYKKLADVDMKRYKEEMETFLTREARAGIEDDSGMPPSLFQMREEEPEDGGEIIQSHKRKSSSSDGKKSKKSKKKYSEV